MYKLLAICVAFFTLFIADVSAQFSKGMRITGATVGGIFFNSGKYEYNSPAPTNGYTSTTNSLGITLSPIYGWFISDKVVVGARLNSGYQYEKYIDAESNVTFRKKENKNLSIGLGGFVRNYFSAASSFIPYGQLQIDAGMGSSTTEGFNYTNSYKEVYTGKSSADFSASTSLIAGVTKMLNNHLGLDFFTGYTYSYNKNDFKTNYSRDIDFNGSIDEAGVSDISTKFSNHGFSIGAGLQIFLSGKK
jgi:hypothetical protein